MGENELFSGIFPGSGQTKPGTQGKKLAFDVKANVSGERPSSAARRLRCVPWRALLGRLLHLPDKGRSISAAIVAVARHLLAVVWSVLTQRKSYRHYSDERIAYKYYTWSWQLDDVQRKGLTRPQFVRYYLMRLGIGSDLQRMALDPKYPHRLASEAEVLELMQDLHPPG